MRNRQVLLNAILSATRSFVSGLIFLALYRFLLKTIGVEQLGVWSVVLATTSLTGLVNLGLSTSVVKFVAKYLSTGEERLACGVVETAAISMGLFFGFVLLLANHYATYLLTLVVPVANLEEALSILPYSLLALWITLVGSIFQAGLDGSQRIDLRNGLLVGADFVYLLLCILLVPEYRLKGLAYAQVAQTSSLLVASWLTLRRQLPLFPFIPCRWSYRLFREMVSYGMNLQVISFSQMLFDPVTKALLAKFGGLSMTGLYEIASKVIVGIRSLLVNAAQVIVPIVASLQEKDREMIHKVYVDCCRVLSYIALPLFSVVVALAPIISHMIIGYYEATFVGFLIVLSIGWFLNTLTAPAYFADVGIGDLGWSTIGHIIIAIMNFGVGWLLGSLYGGKGVVVAWAISDRKSVV